MNSKRIATVSNGYTVTKMSIAVVVNQERIATILGANATPEQVKARVDEIQKVVASATGFNETRGDVISVSAVEFIDGLDGVEIEEPGFIDGMSQYFGTMINAGAFVLVVFLVTWFGIKPMVSAATRPATAALPAPSFEEVQRSLPNPDGSSSQSAGAITATGLPGNTAIDDLRQKIRPMPQDRLARMVDVNEERTAQILRKWTTPEAA
jgi:flagellar M-ring protein FliF